MAKATVRETREYTLTLNQEEAETLAEILFVVQLGLTGKGAISSKISTALEEVGMHPSFDPAWENDLMDGKIIKRESLDTGVYWV